MRNFKLTVAYDGSRYNGWQRQGNTADTVQGKIEAVLGKMLGHKVEINASGRTDAGVHAIGQVASFPAETDMAAGEIMDYLNTYLPMDIAVTKVEDADPRFHARLCAKKKVYAYRIWTERYPNVFERSYMYELKEELDLEKMRHSAEIMTRKADFIGYSSLKRTKKSTVREVSEIGIERLGGEVRLTFAGNGFCITWCVLWPEPWWRWA